MPALNEQTVEQREAKFAAAYATDFNPEAAALAVGYSAKTARIQGYRLLARDTVQALLRKKISAVVIKHDVTLDKVIRELARCGFSNMMHYTRLEDDGLRMIDFRNADEDKMAAVSSIEVVEKSFTTEDGTQTTRTTKLRLHDKISSLTTLHKHLTLGHGGEEKSGDQHYHVHVVIPPAAPGEDRSYRNVQHRPNVIESTVTDVVAEQGDDISSGEPLP